MRGEEEEDIELDDNQHSEKIDSEKSIADKYIVKTKPTVKKSNSRKIVPFVIILCVLAFIAGVVPGFLNFSQLNSTDNLQISEDAFPSVMINNTSQQNQVETSNYTEQDNTYDNGSIPEPTPPTPPEPPEPP
jgi:hypothetical protein